MRSIALIAHNLRSCHNVGSLLRTAEGLGIENVYLTGHTPYPLSPDDARLPHIATKLSKQIAKTALGADELITWQHQYEIEPLIKQLRSDGYQIVALEQTATAIELPGYKVPGKIAIIVGREVEGVEPDVIELTDEQIVIPMFGQKESFNVVQAAAMALYHCTFH